LERVDGPLLVLLHAPRNLHDQRIGCRERLTTSRPSFNLFENGPERFSSPLRLLKLFKD
jgi:hypothetical protein